MSSRHARKVCGSKSYLTPTVPQDDSESDYEPLYTKNASKSSYAALVLSSNSESEPEFPVKGSSDDEDTAQPTTSRKKKRNNKKKAKARAEKGEKLDEIDKSLMEVNALLGPPSPGPVLAPDPVKVDAFRELMAVQPKHLNVATELKRLFGPDDTIEDKRSRHQRACILKKIMVKPMSETTLYEFKRNGLSMSVNYRDGDLMYFIFDHSLELQNMHKKFLYHFRTNHNSPILSLADRRQTMHAEALLQTVKVLFRMEEYSLANEIVENVVAYMQHCAHPYFNLASGNVRLDYRFWENRPFHVAVLRYIYLLSNKACHRTALELAKMLISLDPRDPLAVIFVIDTLALRAREHQWLIEAIDYFNKERETGILLNIQCSYALAHFHVAKKNNGDLAEADKLLQDAIQSYPSVVTKILECANITNARIQSYPLYDGKSAHLKCNEVLNELILIYAKLTWPRWREAAVLEWFLRNAIEVGEKHSNSEDVKAYVRDLTLKLNALLRSVPLELGRHLAILTNMSSLIIETKLSTVRMSAGWDPLLCPGHNRYNYMPRSTQVAREQDVGGSAVFRFFASMIPDHPDRPPADD